jgi:NodT family efflux transporter outer membrane factor (OMF) lipoprotein
VKRSPPIALVLGLLTAGCSLAPPYKSPPESVPATPQYQELDGWKTAQPMDEVPRGDWWRLYQDPTLDELEQKVGAANQNIQAAFARLLQARADTRIARADFLPTVTASAAAQREHISPNSPSYLPGKPTTGTDFNLEGDVSYEIDLWGRVRNQVASARANQQASAADLASLDLSIRAELAMDYFNLRSADAQQQMLNQTVRDYQQSLQLTQNLFNGGAAPLSDVAQAETQLQTAMTQAADIGLQREQDAHAIAVLVGENPSSFHMAVNPLPIDVAPPALDPGLPSALLERRPDVAEAERRVAAANAQIGVARAAYFPQFTLDGSVGFNSVRASNWISAPSRFWSLGPQLTVPLFEGGRLVAQTDRAKAQYEEQVADYRNTVLTAYQDVEDSLAALRQLQQEAQTESAAVKSAAVELQQANYRYSAGAVTYLEVATAETTALQAQLSAANIQARRLNASVTLIKALGGGWQSSTALTSRN